MELLAQVIDAINNVLRWPLVIGLLGTGLFLTFRLGFIQFRRLGHGFAVATGRYDDPDEPGDVSHFQALTTALSATVGVGNIAGVALAIHIGGPGALFWMWVTALLGMATKYAEVTLAQQYRDVHVDEDGKAWEGSVSGGPMYYIERGLGRKWKPVAMFFAFALMITSFMTGNAVQANTVATQVFDSFGIDPWITGLITASIVGVVILGGISRIGKVTSIVAPAMAAVYVFGALLILILNIGAVPAAFGRIFSEAFNPVSGVAGTGAGVFLLTMLYGVQRGLFSNEAGQGSAPIAHSAAKTDEPVSEGAVALLEPFIDTIIICTMTGLVLVSTGAFEATAPAPIELSASNVTIVEGDRQAGFTPYTGQDVISYNEGMAQTLDGPRIGRFNVGVDTLYVDEAQTQVFTGTVRPPAPRGARRRRQRDPDVVRQHRPHVGPADDAGVRARAGAHRPGRDGPLHRPDLGDPVRHLDVDLVELLRRPLRELPVRDQGHPAVQGRVRGHALRRAVLAVTTIWDLGDVALSLVTLPNVLALLLLSPVLEEADRQLLRAKPWEQNKIDHDRAKAEGRL